MNKELTPSQALDDLKYAGLEDDEVVCFTKKALKKRLDIIEAALKQAQEDKEMLDIFKNALTVERDIPPKLEIKESEKGCSYIFKEAVKIHENRIEETLKKSLKEWVLKNAFPKELKALEIIKKKAVNVFILLHSGDLETYNDMVEENRKLTKEEFNSLKEVLKNV